MGARALSLVALLVGFSFWIAAPALAQDSAALKSGAASLEAGKYDTAVRQLTAAVNAEGNSAATAARALYLRGIANRKLGQPSRAIADLGAAIWLGLAGADRTKALVNRGLAYKAAGLGTQAAAEIALARKSGSSSEVDKLLAEDGGPAPDAGAITAFSTEVRSGDDDSDDSSPFAGPAPAAPAARTAEAPASAPSSKPAERGSWSTSVDDASAPAPSGGNRLTRWFSSVTGPSDAPEPPATAATETASRQPAPTTGWAPQTEGQTKTRTADSTPSATTATSGSWTTQVAEATPTAAPASSGSYRLQLTPTRSEAEAKALWKKVSAANPELSGTQPSIEKTDIGNLGTFYRLQVGPFPDKAASLKLCNSLKRSGVDCFLVAP
ncbi:MAG: SPOR domain-containing protein [Methyloceanibacter sp.]|uniref:SPOR domain-containing protein n=1 Tax=Methyloceanibacter sp. TaxID=1965321 RepID=UPI003D9B945E